MRNTGIAADIVTVTSVFRAIGVISALDVGKRVHAFAFKIGCASNLYAQNGLVSMYGKCGSINNAKREFLTMKERNLISWNSLIAGYSQHGYTEEVIELFEEMRRTRIQLDNATFTTVISACSRTGLIGRGLEYFNILRKRDPFETLSVELYTSVVDMLGRAGYVNEAEALSTACQYSQDTLSTNLCYVLVKFTETLKLKHVCQTCFLSNTLTMVQLMFFCQMHCLHKDLGRKRKECGSFCNIERWKKNLATVRWSEVNKHGIKLEFQALTFIYH